MSNLTQSADPAAMPRRTAIVLGGITNHIPLINKLKERGFYTVLVDYLDNPPAKAVADEHLQLSTFDFEAIEAVARERKAEVVINCCLEHLNKGISQIAEHLGLGAPYSYETAVSISDKEIMKAKMVRGGIPTTRHACIAGVGELDGLELTYPVFVKPAEGSGSNAVSHCQNRAEAEEAVAASLARYPRSRIIVEEEAPGEEYNVYCFPCDGKANVLMVVRRYTDNDSDHVTKCIGTVGPADISPAAYENILRTADGIVREFGLDNVPMFMQIMISGDQINVIEFAGRMAGGFSDRAILETTGFDLYEATINAFLGVHNDVRYHAPDQYITVSSVYASACIFDHVQGCEALLDDHTLVDIMIPRKPGTEITETSSNGSKAAYLIAKAPTLAGLSDKLDRVFETLDVIDQDGISRIKREKRITRKMLGV